MNKIEVKKLFEIAKLAEEKGFKTKTVTTKVTNDYLLGGKNVMITEMCIYLWLCELQKWLREVHSIHIEVLPRYQPKKLNTEEVLYSWAISCKPFDKYDGHNDVLNHWIGIHNGAPYIEDIFYHVVKTYEEALEFGLQESLKLIK